MDKKIHYRHIDNMILLRNCTLFSDLAPSELQRLVLLVREHRYGYRETIISKGSKLSSLFIIKQGTCSLGDVEYGHGQSILEAGLFIPSFIADDALVAESEVVMISVTKDDLYTLLKNNPTTSIRLVEWFAQQLIGK